MNLPLPDKLKVPSNLPSLQSASMITINQIPHHVSNLENVEDKPQNKSMFLSQVFINMYICRVEPWIHGTMGEGEGKLMGQSAGRARALAHSISLKING